MIVLFLIVFTFPLLNCGGSRHEATEKYYLVATNIKIPYWQSAGDGLSKAATELGVKYEFVGPDTYDPKAEVEEFQRVLAPTLRPIALLHGRVRARTDRSARAFTRPGDDAGSCVSA